MDDKDEWKKGGTQDGGQVKANTMRRRRRRRRKERKNVIEMNTHGLFDWKVYDESGDRSEEAEEVEEEEEDEDEEDENDNGRQVANS